MKMKHGIHIAAASAASANKLILSVIAVAEGVSV
jgi:hypothetical protein